MQSLAKTWPQASSIGFVPTMGYLHEGHLSLVAESNLKCDITVVSIYVNPSQFGPREDLSSYPRDLDRDLELLGRHKVDYVFFPSDSEMYPTDYKTWVEVDGLSSILCGASRPGHFRGVATIVLKLVNIVKPNLMFMGEKDFQQVTVLKTMLKDLNLETQIVPCPIIREKDGLAMSSRNVYLTPQERQQALCLFEAIQKVQKLFQQDETSAQKLLAAAEQQIQNRGGKIDYLKLIDPENLADIRIAEAKSRLVMAVFIGKTRLIDNSSLGK